MMRRTEVLKLGYQKVTLRELTVGEVRNLLASRPEQDTVGYMFFEDITIAELLAMTDLSDDDVNNLSQSELDAVRLKAKELNPHFFAMMTRLKNLTAT